MFGPRGREDRKKENVLNLTTVTKENNEIKSSCHQGYDVQVIQRREL